MHRLTYTKIYKKSVNNFAIFEMTSTFRSNTCTIRYSKSFNIYKILY